MRVITVVVSAGILSVAICGGAYGQVYKWVDGNGVTHYSEKPPESGKSKAVTLHDANAGSTANNLPGPGGPIGPNGAKTAKSGDPGWKEQDNAFKRRQLARDQADAKLAQQKTANDEACAKARIDLADMRSTGRMYSVNEKGEREFYSDEQRNSAIAAREQEYNQHCQ
jgi:hypothetical protein